MPQPSLDNTFCSCFHVLVFARADCQSASCLSLPFKNCMESQQDLERTSFYQQLLPWTYWWVLKIINKKIFLSVRFVSYSVFKEVRAVCMECVPFCLYNNPVRKVREQRLSMNFIGISLHLSSIMSGGGFYTVLIFSMMPFNPNVFE